MTTSSASSSTANPGDALSLLQDLVDRARRAGADAADAIMVDGASISVDWRLGRLEGVERSEGRDLGLRVFIGQSNASVSTTDFSRGSLDAVVERAIAMAKATPPDRFAGLAPEELLSRTPHDLDLADLDEPSTERLTERARIAEDEARAVPGITNSEGAGASWGSSVMALVTSHGFAGSYRSSSHGVGVSVVAGEGTGMERDYDGASARHAADLEDPAMIGRQAANRALRRLNPRKVATQKVPVVFEPRIASSLLGHLVGAISGSAIARGTSFLKDRLDKPVFAPGIHVIDDPLRPRGLRSRPFDGEGLETRAMALIDDGRLTTWLLDSASARQLGLRPTGHASRGISGPPGPGPSNLHLAPGSVSAKALMADIAQGFYITELIGFGVNGVTGDYSRGAAGYWIENGELAFPVSELTIAGNLKDMFAGLTPADDLEFRYGTNAPTVRIDGMTVAGR
ncbi:TldD/PmbA family protein [Zavarzinia sp. CC-PAN008]|uniref:TldD/PmbA family protein n=1 Tax=Zavarzinia sp. CC-PAN008 TaxID=3243332 RepID=UPI003F745B97